MCFIPHSRVLVSTQLDWNGSRLLHEKDLQVFHCLFITNLLWVTLTEVSGSLGKA